jgi:hypothetical protein
VNSIVKGIDVRAYFRYSELMQIIMHKFGCFEGVMETSGKFNQEVRDELKFLRPKKMHKYLKGEFYYIDIVSAFPSCMTCIPTNLGGNSFNFKIQELIEKMFNILTHLKDKESKLKDTIKLLMNSCYGVSMKKPKQYSTKYSDDVMAKVDREFPYVVKYNMTNGKAGFVSTIDTFHQHFNHVQFTKVILDNFDNKVKELEKLVQIYYYNIDSFIVDKEGFEKLCELELIGKKMGMYKVIGIFDEVVFEGPRKFMAKCSDESIYCRPEKLIEKISYNDFRDSVLEK